MPVRTKRLARGNVGAAGTPVKVYTAPAGETVILKDLRLWCFGPSITRAQVWVLSGPAAPRLVDRGLSLNEAYGLMPWVVLGPGDEVWVQSSTTDSLVYWLSGSELEGVAD